MFTFDLLKNQTVFKANKEGIPNIIATSLLKINKSYEYITLP